MCSSFKLIVLTALALASLAACLPTDFRTFKPIDLLTVLNRTVCPIEVKIDEDPARIPQRIKHLKCARDVNRWCSQMNVPRNECCHHSHDGVSLSCVEIEDVVMVYFPKADQSQPLRIAVGCACVAEESVRVPEATPGR